MMNIALVITVATALCYAGIASANGQSRKSASGSAERKATTGGKTACRLEQSVGQPRSGDQRFTESAILVRRKPRNPNDTGGILRLRFYRPAGRRPESVHPLWFTKRRR